MEQKTTNNKKKNIDPHLINAEEKQEMFDRRSIELCVCVCVCIYFHQHMECQILFERDSK